MSSTLVSCWDQKLAPNIICRMKEGALRNALWVASAKRGVGEWISRYLVGVMPASLGGSSPVQEQRQTVSIWDAVSAAATSTSNSALKLSPPGPGSIRTGLKLKTTWLLSSIRLPSLESAAERSYSDEGKFVPAMMRTPRQFGLCQIVGDQCHVREVIREKVGERFLLQALGQPGQLLGGKLGVALGFPPCCLRSQVVCFPVGGGGTGGVLDKDLRSSFGQEIRRIG